MFVGWDVDEASSCMPLQQCINHISYNKYLIYIDIKCVTHIYIYVYIYYFFFKGYFLNTKAKERFEMLEPCFFVIVVQVKGGCAVYRIEETKLVCAISRKFVLG